jgi:methyltransferase (TIGR00027 family)
MRDIASGTAEGSAYLRFRESSRPREQRLCNDHLAYHLMAWWLKIASAAYMHFPTALDMSIELEGKGVAAFIAVRTRLFDEFVVDQLRRGAQQYVILGAGLDSRAYRLAHHLGDIPVFEVDHPRSQAVKKQRLQTYLGGLPLNIGFVSLDLTQDELLPVLMAHGYDPTLRTVFTLEGLVMYLDETTNRSIFRTLYDHSGPGSGVIFDYVYSAALDGRIYHRALDHLSLWQYMFDEPLLFGIEADGAVQFLRQIGFSEAEDYSPARLYEEYVKPVDPQRTIADIYAIAAGCK